MKQTHKRWRDVAPERLEAEARAARAYRHRPATKADATRMLLCVLIQLTSQFVQEDL